MRQLTKILNIDAMLKKQAIEPVPTQDELLSKILIVDEKIPEAIINASSTQLRNKLKEYYTGKLSTIEELNKMSLPVIIDYIISNRLYMKLLMKGGFISKQKKYKKKLTKKNTQKKIV